MKTATFNHKGIAYTAAWNEKSYGAPQKRYVEVTSSASYGTTKMEYTNGGWVKNAGMPYAQLVAVMLGFELVEKDVILGFGKYEGKKISEVPVSYLMWLVAHKKVLKSSNQLVIEDVKAFLA